MNKKSAKHIIESNHKINFVMNMLGELVADEREVNSKITDQSTSEYAERMNFFLITKYYLAKTLVDFCEQRIFPLETEDTCKGYLRVKAKLFPKLDKLEKIK